MLGHQSSRRSLQRFARPRLELLEDRTVLSLVAAYGFDEGSGTTLNDASGHGLHGTISGAIWSTTGKHGGALNFDGVSDWVTIADNDLLDLTDGMTLEAWVKLDVATEVRDVLIKEGAGVDVFNLYARNWRGLPEGNVFVAGSNRTAEGTTLGAGVWVHLAAVYDGSELRYYANGVQQASLSISGSLPSSTGPLRIGGNSLWGEFFDGRIDDVRVYNHALTQAEIQADMLVAVSTSSDTTAPRVVSTSPKHTATDVGADVNVTVRFNEPMNPATVNTSTIELRDSAGVVVSATVTYDSATQTATLDPLGPLPVTSPFYVATVRGGSSGVTDLAGNPMTAFSWSFTTAPVPPMTVQEVTIDGNGVQYYSATSAYQGGQATTLRVLRPDNPAPGQPHRFLYVLPVYTGYNPNDTFGDGLA
ncbi:MAG: Ig-like domain-containing protein, partial [Gemmataceae bacterium]|nr:Ig-like domain-containing protein [Gemmataceae bacterium]